MAEVEENHSTLVNPRRAESPHSTPSPPVHSPHSSSPNTTMTTPDQSPGNDDDIWDTSSDHEHAPHAAATAAALTGGASDFPAQSSTDTSSHGQGGAARIRREVILSDVPSLRRQHMTDGYREGLSVGKARVMQSGFDAGYPLGVEVGLRVGKVLGVLEGVVSALTTKPARSSGKPVGEAGLGSSTATGSNTSLPGIEGPQHGVVDREDEPHGLNTSRPAPGDDDDLTFVRNLYTRAQRELKISELLKGLDDEKIASIPDAAINSTSGGDGDGGGGMEHKQAERAAPPPPPPLPTEIEAVLVKWERTVLGALRKND
ncbi:hypothetical protein Z517_08031 [Fonsecaea pedrosoi CBS 271.37]|uniref:Protein YAE1 n=1 Tax=Fonsecaea pedrosoi CBS 271.37 TaxID=1442368 RepID=A0A0D2GC10_9EURO|nr:uncharacterized protein Z517_08031 [Fonsecaea pedrosoi CBS 271.37]KIW78198.1 hypothetical protein Z517_08031 [Fonsecaea pedrosoi CBS 271.37]